MKNYKILVLGGYGNFGKRVCAGLAAHPGACVLAAGRNPQKADLLARKLREAGAGSVKGYPIDIDAKNFKERVSESKAQLLIHAAGPFQDQSYKVAKSCIDSGVNYIDLADNRKFVTGIGALADEAKKSNVLLISGASTVPGLSAAVVDHYQGKFQQIKEIIYGFVPGNKTERGEATVKSILSYTGKPFLRRENGSWKKVFGWQDIHRHQFPEPAGRRWVANCDIPDLELFPARYPGVEKTVFHAGLELASLHLGLWLLSWPARFGLIGNWARYSKIITGMSRWVEHFGTDIGAMFVTLRGTGKDGKKLTVCWDLITERGEGIEVPAIAPVLLAKKSARGEIREKGAKACMGLFTLNEFMNEAARWNIYQKSEEYKGEDADAKSAR
ncbi:MAG: saccharopine dehydrogenase [Gammaproteobacteria bacterium]|nr:saccharopine dehydrogenase [Gammaproteobacteria bacterium]